MKLISLIFLFVFGLFHNLIIAQPTSNNNNYLRMKNRITAQPQHVYQIKLQIFETKKELTNRLKKQYNSTEIFFPSDSILVIQSSFSIEESQLIKIIKNKTNTIYNCYYKYINGEILNKKDSTIKAS